VGAAAIREKPEEANPNEALRQHVEKEVTEEFVGTDRHRARRAAVCIVLPPKRDLVVGDVDDPMIRDRDAVRVTRQVVQDMRWTAERRSGVDDPIVSKELAESAGARPPAT
jgi:hypothetical protein